MNLQKAESVEVTQALYVMFSGSKYFRTSSDI